MNPLKAARKAIRRQKIRNHIRREQEEFLREHPELRMIPTRGVDSLPGIDPSHGSEPGTPMDFDD